MWEFTRYREDFRILSLLGLNNGRQIVYIVGVDDMFAETSDDKRISCSAGVKTVPDAPSKENGSTVTGYEPCNDYRRQDYRQRLKD